jgi:hypothetical protein
VTCCGWPVTGYAKEMSKGDDPLGPPRGSAANKEEDP